MAHRSSPHEIALASFEIISIGIHNWSFLPWYYLVMDRNQIFPNHGQVSLDNEILILMVLT